MKKICRECKKFRFLFEFWKSKAHGGINDKCRICYKQDNIRNKDSIAASSKKWHDKNKERSKILHKKWKISNKKLIKINNTKYMENNREVLKERSRANYLKNKKEISKAKKIKWKNGSDDYKSLVCAKNAKSKARKKNAVPKWLSKRQEEEILKFYHMARSKTKRTGVKHAVDHIIPFNGKNVVGLHVPWNLQILSRSDNSVKGARL